MFWIWTTWTTAISLESKTASCQRMDNRNPANLRCYRGGRQWAGIFRPFVFVCRPGECPKGSRHRPFTTTAVRTPIAVISRQGERGDNQNPFHRRRGDRSVELDGNVFLNFHPCCLIIVTTFHLKADAAVACLSEIRLLSRTLETNFHEE
ncbi:uncharacterized protein LOC143143720 isoform X4 [Ptiloglossa arizonensis]|uniref:uncharacterized protein LOC143143720 isoform X4 n=1 Tax=Ptiloglossa arizonensis TaxID=3350558 RepID=UPI003FA08683